MKLFADLSPEQKYYIILLYQYAGVNYDAVATIKVLDPLRIERWDRLRVFVTYICGEDVLGPYKAP